MNQTGTCRVAFNPAHVCVPFWRSNPCRANPTTGIGPTDAPPLAALTFGNGTHRRFIVLRVMYGCQPSACSCAYA
jgi:hypothetical protein